MIAASEKDDLLGPEQNPFGWPVQPPDRSDRSLLPFEALGDEITASIIPSIHPENDNIKAELEEFLKMQFSSPNTEDRTHRTILLALRTIGFDVDPAYAEAGSRLLTVADDEAFRRYIPASFRFTRGEDLADYLFAVAEDTIASHLKSTHGGKLSLEEDFYGWYENLSKVFAGEKQVDNK